MAEQIVNDAILAVQKFVDDFESINGREITRVDLISEIKNQAANLSAALPEGNTYIFWSQMESQATNLARDNSTAGAIADTDAGKFINHPDLDVILRDVFNGDQDAIRNYRDSLHISLIIVLGITVTVYTSP